MFYLLLDDILCIFVYVWTVSQADQQCCTLGLYVSFSSWCPCTVAQSCDVSMESAGSICCIWLRVEAHQCELTAGVMRATVPGSPSYPLIKTFCPIEVRGETLTWNQFTQNGYGFCHYNFMCALYKSDSIPIVMFASDMGILHLELNYSS